MFVVDTNVLVYAANRNAPEYAPCRRLVESWRGSALPWYTTWAILYEFLRVITHPRVLEKPWPVREAWRFLEAVLASPSLGLLVPSPRHADIAAQTFEEFPSIRGNLLHDTHTVVLMREHGIRRIVTRDADFHRFSFIEVIDPLEAE